MLSLKQAIMERDDLSEQEAQEWIDDAITRLGQTNDPEEQEEILEEFGLEPDYTLELLLQPIFRLIP